jgi:hypothetical protein
VGLTEWPDGATRVARDTQWTSRADRHPDGCPMEGGRVPDGGGQVPDEGHTGAEQRAGVARQKAQWVPNEEREWPDGGCDGCPTEGGVLGGGPTAGIGGGPTGDYISVVGPHFWALSSCAQSHLQEMRELRVLMSESGVF